MRIALIYCSICAVVGLPRLSSAASFTVVALPDTQHYSESFPDQFNSQTQWIAGDRATDNIVFVTQLGDIVQNGAEGADQNAAEWNNADAAMGILDNVVPDLPYGAVLGNHDYDVVSDQSAAEQYANFFGASRYSGRPWYGGSSPDEFNHYQQFTAGGRNFLHITLEWRPRASSLNWAQSVLDGNSSVPTIISTHEYTTSSGDRTTAGNDIFNSIVDNNSQVFMVLSGHKSEGHQTETNAAGLEVFEMLANYQGRPNGGNGWMRLIEFDEASDQINVKTYSPTLDEFETDLNSQFTLNVNFDARFGVILELTGDYNLDGDVNAADYTVWSDTFGQTGPDLPADGNGDGLTNAGDYTIWANHFGESISAPSGAPAAVPEPSTLALLVIGLVGLLRYGWLRRRGA